MKVRAYIEGLLLTSPPSFYLTVSMLHRHFLKIPMTIPDMSQTFSVFNLLFNVLSRGKGGLEGGEEREEASDKL